LSAEYGRNARKFLLEKASIRKIINFGDLPIFQNALTYVSIFILSKGITGDFLYKKVFELNGTIPVENIIINSKMINENPWALDEGHKVGLIEKMRTNYPKLLSKGKCWAGLITGKDEILMFDKNDLKTITFEKEILLPVLRAQDCHKYSYAEASKYVIYPYMEDEEKDKTVIIPQNELKAKYPKVYKYLSSHKDILSKRKDSRKEISDKKVWYSLVRFGRHSIFKKPKIISPGEVSNNKFALDTSGSGFSCARVFAITTTAKDMDIKFLLGLLNSKLVEFYLHSICPLKAGGYFQYSAEFIDSVPLPNNLVFQKKEVKEIIQLVNKLLANNKSHSEKKKAENILFENKINELVYKLYDISEEEISIIEGTLKKDRKVK
jgi:hypothetical protein